MAYDDFVKLAIIQDSRNFFKRCDTDLTFLPAPLRSFYTANNPVDIEITLPDSTTVRFSPMRCLKELQEEYGLGDSTFVFATHEGDPIYHKATGIFSCTHGGTTINEVKISDSFDSYIEMLQKEMLQKNMIE